MPTNRPCILIMFPKWIPEKSLGHFDELGSCTLLNELKDPVPAELLLKKYLAQLMEDQTGSGVALIN
ncbi:hypothetical protein ACQKFG_03455 [Peribacillus sp. NPDC076916]|uniref:hypothetical protein n=1 Tax=Peribacillus sp. NPDC076916 TaxID=3390608 RepID=UPI003CFED2FD